jgi:hypothetical protein
MRIQLCWQIGIQFIGGAKTPYRSVDRLGKDEALRRLRAAGIKLHSQNHMRQEGKMFCNFFGSLSSRARH